MFENIKIIVIIAWLTTLPGSSHEKYASVITFHPAGQAPGESMAEVFSRA